MANIPVYSDKEITDRKVDFDMSMVYNMPFIERTIFQHALRDVCLKEIINYESTKDVSTMYAIHPKNSLPEARELLRCFAKKYSYHNYIVLKWNLFVTDLLMMPENAYLDPE